MSTGTLLVASAVLTLAGGQVLFAAGNRERSGGEAAIAEYAPPAFEVLYIRANADVRIHRSESQRIVISAPSNLSEKIELRTKKKNELEIRVKGKAEKFPRFSVDVYTPPLSGIGAAYNATVEFSGDVALPSFMIGQAGAAEIRGSLDCETVEINTAGGGTILLTGSAQSVKINMVGDGTVDAQNFKAADTAANIVGAGKILTWTTGDLSVNGVGNGTIYYRGTEVIDFNAVGSGRIIRLPDNS